MDKKEIKAYNKMHDKHRKAMIKLAKNDADYDWYHMHNLVITKVRHMYEYYCARNNVWQSDESLDVVLKSLRHVLDLQDELDHLWDLDEEDKRDLEEFSVTHKLPVASNGSVEKTVALDKREQELYQEIYEHIGKYILWWWD